MTKTLFLCLIVGAMPIFLAVAGSSDRASPRTSSGHTSLEDALGAIGESPATLVIDRIVSAGDCTVPPSYELSFTPGGRIDVRAGCTVRIQRTIDAGLHPIFGGEGSVVFDRAPVEKVFPQWWGARGDSTFDNRAAVQAAVDAMPSVAGSSERHGVLFFPPGRYLIGKTPGKTYGVRIPADYEIIIAGSGSGSVITAKDAGMEKGIFFFDGGEHKDGSVGDNIRRCVVRDLQFDGGRVALFFNYPSYNTVENCAFTGIVEGGFGSWAIKMVNESPMYSEVSANFIRGNRFFHSNGIRIEQIQQTHRGNGTFITNNSFTEEPGGGENRETADLQFEMISITDHDETRISNNLFSTNWRESIKLENCSRTFIDGNVFQYTGRRGDTSLIRVIDSEDIKICNNLLHPWKLPTITGIRVEASATQRSANIDIVNNTFVKNEAWSSAIDIGPNCSGVNIVSNILPDQSDIRRQRQASGATELNSFTER